MDPLTSGDPPAESVFPVSTPQVLWVRGPGSKGKSISNREHGKGTANPEDTTECPGSLGALMLVEQPVEKGAPWRDRVAATKWEQRGMWLENQRSHRSVFRFPQTRGTW